MPEKNRDIDYSIEDVYKKLLNTKDDKAPGADGIHPKVLHECCRTLADPLHTLFRRSLQEDHIPDDWRVANVIPIYKKGGRRKAGNYRPVSLTSQVCKVMEKIVRDGMLRHVARHALLSDSQHGFTKGRSCLTNLLETIEEWTAWLDEGQGIDVIYLDYQKAFDTVPHMRLVHKLSQYGIRGHVNAWVKDFLTDRQQRVVVNTSSSEWAEVKSGVPQGSVLGPLLFLLYVNELPEIIQNRCKMFADDTKVYGRVKQLEDGAPLQRDLSTLDAWSEDWLLKFNAGKCKVMHIGTANPKIEYSMKTGDTTTTLSTVETEKDVGVWMADTLKPSIQCTKAAAKAMRALGMVRRSFTYLDRSSLILVFNCYVRPHLEYCVQAWCPYLKKDIICLEKVQRRATKLVPGLRELPYEDRLKRLQLYSLQRRRLRGDLIETFKILRGLEQLDSARFFQPQEGTTRGHNFKLFKPRARLQVRQQTFSHRVVTPWNKLPSNVVSANSVEAFKSNLDKHWRLTGYGYQIGQ